MSVIKYKHHGSSSALILLSQHRFFSVILLASVFSPRPCPRIINIELVWAPESRGSPHHLSGECSQCSQPRAPCRPCPPGRILIEIYCWRCLLRRVSGYPHSLSSDISIMPQIVTLGREQTTHSSSPRSHNVNQDKLIALGIVSNTGHESLVRVCLSWVRNRPTDLQEMIWRIQTHP